jgi:hypothetical protein
LRWSNGERGIRVFLIGSWERIKVEGFFIAEHWDKLDLGRAREEVDCRMEERQ